MTKRETAQAGWEAEAEKAVRSAADGKVKRVAAEKKAGVATHDMVRVLRAAVDGKLNIEKGWKQIVRSINADETGTPAQKRLKNARLLYIGHRSQRGHQLFSAVMNCRTDDGLVELLREQCDQQDAKDAVSAARARKMGGGIKAAAVVRFCHELRDSKDNLRGEVEMRQLRDQVGGIGGTVLKSEFELDEAQTDKLHDGLADKEGPTLPEELEEVSTEARKLFDALVVLESEVQQRINAIREAKLSIQQSSNTTRNAWADLPEWTEVIAEG